MTVSSNLKTVTSSLQYLYDWNWKVAPKKGHAGGGGGSHSPSRAIYGWQYSHNVKSLADNVIGK